MPKLYVQKSTNKWQGTCTLKFIITFVKSVFDFQIDKLKNTNLSWMNKKCINATAHNQTILHRDTLYNIKRKKCKRVCAELPFAKVNRQLRKIGHDLLWNL